MVPLNGALMLFLVFDAFELVDHRLIAPVLGG